MTQKRSKVAALTMLATMSCALPALGGIVISRVVFGCDAGRATSTTFIVDSTLGETVCGVATSASFTISSGFWYSSYSPEPTCRADFNGDGFLTFEDFDDFVSAFGDGLPASDFDGDGFITFEDFDAFVAAFREGC